MVWLVHMLGGGVVLLCFLSFLCCFSGSVLFFWVVVKACVKTYLTLTVFLSRRRIDVSPSAFRKHPQLFEAMKSSEDGTYKVTEHFAV